MLYNKKHVLIYKNECSFLYQKSNENITKYLNIYDLF